MNQTTETLTAQVPSILADSARAAVRAGEYGSVDDVVRAALDDWHERKVEVARLRDLYDQGKRSGIAGPIDEERFLAELNAEFQATSRA